MGAQPDTNLQNAPAANGRSAPMPRIYSNEDLRCSFAIPENWKEENYKIIVSHSVPAAVTVAPNAPVSETPVIVSERVSTVIQFMFCGSGNAELFNITAMPLEEWRVLFLADAPLIATLIGQREDTAFVYYPVLENPLAAEDAELFNTMHESLDSESVRGMFTLEDGDEPFEVTGTVTAADRDFFTLKTEHGSELTFPLSGFGHEFTSAELTTLSAGENVTLSCLGDIENTNTDKTTILGITRA